MFSSSSSSSLFFVRRRVSASSFGSSSILPSSLCSFLHRNYSSAAAQQETNSSSSLHIEADFTTTCPFKCLGLTRTASKEEVRQNFLKLAKIHHPDVGGETKKFRRVQAAYKQSIEMIDTGYAAKTAQKAKQANYRAPNERERNHRGKTGDDDADEEDERHARKSSYYYNSTRQQKQSSSGTKSKTPDDQDSSSASSYAYSERQYQNSAFSSGNRRAADRKNGKEEQSSTFHHSSTDKKSEEQENPEKKSETKHASSASHFYSAKDQKAKSFNSRREWFRETYETSTSSWTTASKKSEEERKKMKMKYQQTTENINRQEGTRYHEEEGEEHDDFFKNRKQKKKTQETTEEEERDFGSEEDWFEFRSNFFHKNAKNLSPRDLYRLRFAQATTMKEIDDIYIHAMNENIFNGFDIGEPLHLALERYHLDSQLGLGEKHLEKCFATIEDWEKRTKSTANCIYYQCILKLYTNENMLALFPNLDASMISEVVWKVLQKMQDKDVSDDSGIAWWNLLNTALMYRDPHGYGGQS